MLSPRIGAHIDDGCYVKRNAVVPVHRDDLRVDDALDGYTIDAVTAGSANERKFYGVTQILRSHANQDHAVQVIAFSGLRPFLGEGQAFIPTRNATTAGNRRGGAAFQSRSAPAP